MWYTKRKSEIIADLAIDPSIGLSSAEAEERLAANGLNEFAPSKKPSVILLFFEQLNSLLIYILIVAAIISLSVAEFSDSVIIVIVILLNAIIGVLQEAKAEKSLDELKNMSTPRALVKRDGIIKEIQTGHVVPGDIVIIDAGRYIPADLRIIETVNLKIEESSLTGESVPVDKEADCQSDNETPIGDQRNMAIMSTTSTYGRGIGVVINTGMQTEIGKIAGMLGSQKRVTYPFTNKIN